VSLQQAGGNYDPGKSNALEIRLARDSSELANVIEIDSGPNLYEASFMLAPLYEISPGDRADVDALSNFVEGSEGFTGDNQTKYREWGFDECAEGHWDIVNNTWVPGLPGVFARVLALGVDPAKRLFVRRYRPGRGNLITTDSNNKPLQAQLWVSTTYPLDLDHTDPKLWDPNQDTGWTQIDPGQWDLLPDRLGIRFTIKDPQELKLDNPASAGLDSVGLNLPLVDAMATPGGVRPRFRLTCVIEDDIGLTMPPEDPPRNRRSRQTCMRRVRSGQVSLPSPGGSTRGRGSRSASSAGIRTWWTRSIWGSAISSITTTLITH
jgi:hypothetical protein